MMRDVGDKFINELQMIIFRLQQKEFGLEINRVCEITPVKNITRLPTAANWIVGVMNLRNEIIPVLRLHQKLRLLIPKAYENKARIIVVEMNQAIVGILVEEVVEIIKINEQEMTETPDLLKKEQGMELIKGIIKRDDRLILILDVDNLFSLDESAQIKNNVS